MPVHLCRIEFRRLYGDGLRTGEITPFRGHPYASVLAFDMVPADPSKIVDTKLYPNSPLNGQGRGMAGSGRLEYDRVNVHKTCTAGAAFDPKQSEAPLHYYRIEFKHVDRER